MPRKLTYENLLGDGFTDTTILRAHKKMLEQRQFADFLEHFWIRFGAEVEITPTVECLTLLIEEPELDNDVFYVMFACLSKDDRQLYLDKDYDSWPDAIRNQVLGSSAIDVGTRNWEILMILYLFSRSSNETAAEGGSEDKIHGKG